MEPVSITEVSPEQLKARLERGEDVVVVDLRQAWEYHAGHIPGALSLFIEEIPMRLSELSTDVDTDWLTNLQSCILHAVSWHTKAKRVWQSC
jgi:rhodanese-related sulfurtransferase